MIQHPEPSPASPGRVTGHGPGRCIHYRVRGGVAGRFGRHRRAAMSCRCFMAGSSRRRAVLFPHHHAARSLHRAVATWCPHRTAMSSHATARPHPKARP